MKRLNLIILSLTLMMALTLAAAISLFLHLIPATVAYAKAEGTERLHVYDKANLFSNVELSLLEEQCISYGEEAGLEIMILTHNDPDAVYAEDYIEDFEDQLPAGDRVYLLIDMYNRDVFIEGYGKAETYIHSKRIDKILDEIVPFLSDGKYFDACMLYIEKAAAYMKDDSELNFDHNYNIPPQSDNPNADYYDETWPSGDYYSRNKSDNGLLSLFSNIWVQLIISVTIGAVTVAIMAYNSGGKMTAGSSTYMDHSSAGLIGRRDDYIRTTVTKVRRPKDNSHSTGSHAKGGFNSGGFRGGVSSGGRSHSSGGRKF